MMKRQLLPVLVTIGGLAAVIALVLLFSFELAAAGPAEDVIDETFMAAFDSDPAPNSNAPPSDVRAHLSRQGQRPDSKVNNPGDPYPVDGVSLHVNYALDWVEGNAESPGLSVVVTVTAQDNSVKATATVPSEADGSYFVGCDDWAGPCPDILPGDAVRVATIFSTGEIDPVGHISGLMDEDNDLLEGTLQIPGTSETLAVFCNVSRDPSWSLIETTAAANGGAFTCDFLNQASWDLQRGDLVTLSYEEADGDMVSNVVPWDWSRVNYAQDWVGMNYDLGRTFWIIVTDSGGAVKGSAEAQTTSAGGWGEPGFETEPGQWSPEPPDIIPGDWVHIAADDGYSNIVHVGLISGTLDAGLNQVAGPIFASDFGISLTVECQPWGAWDLGLDVPIKESWAEPDGSVPFSCQWSPGEWDIQPGQEVAAMYVEPDWDRIIDVYDGLVLEPELSIGKHYTSSELPQGKITYTLSFTNSGNLAASGLVITDQLPSNVTWLSGGTYDDGDQTITWNWPELAASGTGEVSFSGELACSGEVANDRYRIVSSDQGFASPLGPEVIFDISQPTIDLSFNHSAEPAAGGETLFQAVSSTNGPAPLTYEWDFGDGQQSDGASPGHTYLTDGEFTVVMTATDPCGYYDTYSKALMVGEPNIVVDFDQSEKVAPIHSTIHFTDTSTTNGAAIAAWLWDFGDGSPTAAQQDVSHTYDSHGAYTVTLVVTDTLGYGAKKVVANAVTTLAPVFEIGKTFDSSQVAGGLVTYTLVVTNVGELAGAGLVITDRLPANVTWLSGGDYDSGIVSWPWPSLATGDEAKVQFIGRLACSGEVLNDRYRVSTSDLGITSPWGDPVSFTIAAPAIQAEFSQSASRVETGGTVVFTDTSTTNGPPLTTFSWDFDDGSTGSGAAVSHVFAASGKYTVELTATDQCGYSETVSHTVDVSDFIIFLPFISKP